MNSEQEVKEVQEVPKVPEVPKVQEVSTLSFFTTTVSVKPNGCRIATVILFLARILCFGKKDKSEEPELKLSNVTQADSPKLYTINFIFTSNI